MDWVKVMCNLLDHRKIKMIRKGPEGNTLVLLWLLMLTEAGKCNRGGYLMISDSLAYTGDTLSMVTDIPLPTVQLGLSIFSELGMIDQEDGVLFIRNWRKYQSEDKLEARRRKDRLRQQRHRDNERGRILALSSSAGLSRDVTPENRQEQDREEQSRKEQTTDTVRLLLADTPLSTISGKDLRDLQQRHGLERLVQAADIAAETWRRKREDPRNPGGYLQALCTSLVVPKWYVPFAERQKQVRALQQQKDASVSELEAIKAQEEAAIVERDAAWNHLTENEQAHFRSLVLVDLPAGAKLTEMVLLILAKLKAWEARQAHGCS